MNTDLGTFPLYAPKLHGPAVQLYNTLADRQAQACAALGPGAGFVNHVKGLGDTGQLRRRDALAAVRHPDAVAGLFRHTLQYYGAAAVNGLPGVVQQVQADGLHQIGFQWDLRRVSPNRQTDTGRLQRWPQGTANSLQKRVHGDQVQRKALLFQHDEIHQLQTERLQTPPFAENVPSAIQDLLRRGRPGAQQVGIANDTHL